MSDDKVEVEDDEVPCGGGDRSGGGGDGCFGSGCPASSSSSSSSSSLVVVEGVVFVRRTLFLDDVSSSEAAVFCLLFNTTLGCLFLLVLVLSLWTIGFLIDAKSKRGMSYPSSLRLLSRADSPGVVCV